MSNVNYHYPKPGKSSLAERVIYNFIMASELLGISFKCDSCPICQNACKRLRQEERNIIGDDNKMD